MRIISNNVVFLTNSRLGSGYQVHAYTARFSDGFARLTQNAAELCSAAFCYLLINGIATNYAKTAFNEKYAL
jgi:TRAP-type C4-dicarboxylate transport system permease small subunit